MKDRRQQRPRKWLLLGLVLLFAVAAGTAAVFYMWPAKSDPVVKQKSTAKSKSTKPSLIKIAAMGDMLAHDTVNHQAKRGDSYDYTAYFKQIRPIYKDADVVFCNPETLSVGSQFGVSGYPAFNAPDEFARDLVSENGADCNLINLASNHTFDRGQTALNANVDQWDRKKVLAFSGANRSEQEQKTVRYFTKNGIKVAFLAFADYSNNPPETPYGLSMYHNAELVDSLMKEARENSDFVIVSLHWGTEDSLAINDDQRQAASHIASLGADVIFGTGPHVLQEAAWLNGWQGRRTLVWYSLGNMLSSQLQINQLTSGIAIFDVEQNSGGKIDIKNISFAPTYMSYDWKPADRAAENLLARYNLRLEPLESATTKPEAMFGNNYSVNERLDFIKNTLGSSVIINFL